MSELLLRFVKVDEAKPDTIAFLTINRPNQANALSFELMQSFIKALEEVKAKENCRALVLQGEGKNFSAGADLGWMKASASMTKDENYQEALVLSQMFEHLYHLPIATIALVKGAAYGGALGLISACDIVIASDKAKFCLSEVNLGLLPAIILPYVARRMRPGDVRRLATTGAVFSGKEAKENGLVNFTVAESSMNDVLHEELNQVLSSAPGAVGSFKDLYHQITSSGCEQSNKTAESIADIRVGEEAQHGLSSFFSKQKPSWVLTFDKDWMGHVSK